MLTSYGSLRLWRTPRPLANRESPRRTIGWTEHAIG